MSWGTGIRTEIAETVSPLLLLYLLLVLSFHLLVLFRKQWGEYEHPWVRTAPAPQQRGPCTPTRGAHLGSEPVPPATTTQGTHEVTSSASKRPDEVKCLSMVKHIKA